MQHPDTKELIDLPNDGVGLVFMSYQASIEAQFQFKQTQWANNESFPSENDGVDPVFGQGGTVGQTWFPAYGSTANSNAQLLRGFVTLKGGEYLFAPSISGLLAL